MRQISVDVGADSSAIRVFSNGSKTHQAPANHTLATHTPANQAMQDGAEREMNHDFLQKYPLGRPLTALDGADMRSLFRAAYHWLAEHYEIVNRLNVFPVPDGDTGTYMLL